MDQELADAAAHAPGRRCLCTHQIATLFCVKCRRGRHLARMTSYQKLDYVNRCVCLFNSKNCRAKFHPDPIWNDGALSYPSKKNKKKKSQASSDMESVPDPKRDRSSKPSKR